MTLQVNHNRFLGYDKDENGNLVINPEQAEIVKRIYREYIEGYSMNKIAAHLESDGILTGAGNSKWHTSTINKILRNEKYMGDALLQKTYTTDFLTKNVLRTMALFHNIMLKEVMRPLFLSTFLCKYRKSLYTDDVLLLTRTEKSIPLAVIMRFLKSSFAESVGTCSVGCIGTIVAINQLYGAASAA